MESVLEVKNLTKLYKNGRGIKDISFSIYQGDVYGFLGPNGAGKTTLMKTITGLCHADNGEVQILGFNTADQFEKAMFAVGSIIENPAFYLYLSAWRNLEMIARFYKAIDKDRINEALKLVGLANYKSAPVHQYSTGMRQRLAIAAAILNEPKMVILDEPTNGLDIEGMADIRKLILRMAREQKTTFFVSSHLAHEMELMCNRVGMINNGKMIAEGLVSDFVQTHTSLEDSFIQHIKDNRRNTAGE